MQHTLNEISNKVKSLAEKINVSHYLLPTYGSTVDSAHPHIEIDSQNRLHYVVVERGEELRRDIATDLDDLLYMIFAGVTFSMACEFEAKHRRKKEDFRRQLFSKQEELLGILNVEWKKREQQEHQRILANHPFEDK